MESSRSVEFQVVVMAAGEGTLLQPLTEKIPKALLPIGHAPVVAYVVDYLARAGFDDVIVVAKRSASVAIMQMVKEVLPLGLKLKLHIHPIEDDSDAGTADSLRQLRDKIHTDFMVVSCDTVTDVPLHELADVHRLNNATMTCLLARKPPTSEPSKSSRKESVVEKGRTSFIGLEPTSNRLIFYRSGADLSEGRLALRRSTLKEHPVVTLSQDLVDAHFYIFARWVLDFICEKKGISAIQSELVPYLVHKQFSAARAKENDIHAFAPQQSGSVEQRAGRIRCYAHVVEAQPLDEASSGDGSTALCARVNTLQHFSLLNLHIFKHLPRVGPRLEDYDGSAQHYVHKSVKLGERSQVGTECMVDNGTVIESYTGIKHSIIGRHCKIGSRCKLVNCVIMDHVTIEDEVKLTNCVVCSNALIKTKCQLTSCQVRSENEIKAETKAKDEVLNPQDAFLM